jgi:hypothetical protein
VGVAAPEDEPDPAFLEIEHVYLLKLKLCTTASSSLDDSAGPGNKIICGQSLKR